MVEDLGIVVVHHRVPTVLGTCLDRLRTFADGARVVVVDTAPDETSLRELRPRNPRALFVAAPNHSLAHAVNLGLRHTRTPFVVHMNADVFIEHDTFPRLFDALRRHPRAGIVGPLCLTRAGRPQSLGPLYRPHYLRLGLRPAGSVAVPWLSGCMQLVRREVLERCGGLDPSLRFYNEDIDFCVRARRAGFGLRLVDAPVVHLGGSSTPPGGVYELEGRRGAVQLSRRYLPPWARRLHLLALAAESRLGHALVRDPARLATYDGVARMLRERSYDLSPFGATLDDLPAPATERA